MLEIRDLQKRFGAVRALDGATLRAAEGSVHAVLGENGAGKSTLSRVLSGVLAAESGTISLGGKPLHLGSHKAARAAGISAAFQELSLIPHLTVAENLTFEQPARNMAGHLLKRRARAQARALLEEVGVRDTDRIDLDIPVRDLDLAVRQVIEVARAVSRRSQVLILDEATSALSPQESAWVLGKAREAAERGAIVIFISHRLNEVREVANDMTIMRAGRTVAEGAVSSLDDQEIIEAMLGRKVESLSRLHDRSRGEVVISAERLVARPRLGPLEVSVHAGEILGVGGLDGHGQRELLNALAGAIPRSGSLRLDGREVRLRTPAEALNKGIVLVPEDRQTEGLLLTHSIRHNVSLSALHNFRSRIGSIDSERELADVLSSASRLKIDVERLDDPVAVLSGGNQQKVVLARALLTKPRVVLLYDCTRGVDVGTKAEIHQLIGELATEGVAVVLYASDVAEMVNLCDRVLVMSEGKIAGELHRGEISSSGILRLAVGARSHEAAPRAAA